MPRIFIRDKNGEIIGDREVDYPLPAPPYRPLQKIVARGPGIKPTSNLQLGDKVNFPMKPKEGRPFSRLYEVVMIDGAMCRLVTPDKRFAMNAETKLIKELRDIQRRSAELKRGGNTNG